MKYDILREAAANAAKSTESEIFRATIIAKTEREKISEEDQFIYEVVFKPRDQHLRLTAAQTQLLLSYFEGMLKQVEGN